MKHRKHIVPLLLSLLAACVLLCTTAAAAGSIQLDRPVSLTLSCQPGGQPLAGARFDLYLLATADGSMTDGLVSGRCGTFVSMGNPHFVCFVPDATGIDVATEGRRLEHDAIFPERCNIEFAEITGQGTIRTRVWERGSGITMACGTGACATAVAAAVTRRNGREARIVMDGGTLEIAWSEADNHVYMSGPAAFAFEGEIALPQEE